jgi:hypothetical protein
MRRGRNQIEYNNIVNKIRICESHDQVFKVLDWIHSYEKLNGKTSADELRSEAIKQIKNI